jgi:peptidyl-tRNA hydrolase, PTH1 family
MPHVLVAGLGNPGSMYRRTRHNVGFMVIEELAARLRCGARPGKGEYEFAECQIGGAPVILLAPTTYMNASGEAVLDALEHFRIPPDRLLVIADDLALSLGTLRVRAAGSDGGHNGLASIIYQLGTEAFPRLRCGIGREERPAKEETADFVLSPFGSDEEEVARAMILRAADAVTTIVESGLDRTMTLYNRAP